MDSNNDYSRDIRAAQDDSDMGMFMKLRNDMQQLGGMSQGMDASDPLRKSFDELLWSIMSRIEGLRGPERGAAMQTLEQIIPPDALLNYHDPRTGNEYQDSPRSLYPGEDMYPQR